MRSLPLVSVTARERSTPVYSSHSSAETLRENKHVKKSFGKQNPLPLLLGRPLQFDSEGLWSKKAEGVWGSGSRRDQEMEVKDKNVGSAGGTVHIWTGLQKIENCSPPDNK